MKKFAAFAMMAALAGCSSSESAPSEDDPMAMLDPAAPSKPGVKPPTVKKPVKPAADPDALLAEMENAANSQEDAARRTADARESERRRREEMARLEVELQKKRSQVEADERARGEHETAMAKLQAENKTFEERYAVEILKVKRELQKYQR